jgi:hypothetical protein
MHDSRKAEDQRSSLQYPVLRNLVQIFQGNFENNEEKSSEFHWSGRNPFPTVKNRVSTTETLLDFSNISKSTSDLCLITKILKK